VAVARKVGSNYWYLDHMYWEAFEEKADIRALRGLKSIEDWSGARMHAPRVVKGSGVRRM
jgi:hypothetical protein